MYWSKSPLFSVRGDSVELSIFLHGFIILFHFEFYFMNYIFCEFRETETFRKKKRGRISGNIECLNFIQ